MGLKDDLIQAKVDGMAAGGVNPLDIDISKGSPIEVECEVTKEAILNFLNNADFRVTDLKAPVVLQSFNHPAKLLDVSVDTVMGPHGVLLKVLKKIAGLVGAGSLLDATESQMKKATSPVAEGGVTQAPPNLDVNSGLDAHGYMFVGDDDPGSSDSFDVSGEDGQKVYTQVKFFRDENEGIS